MKQRRRIYYTETRVLTVLTSLNVWRVRIHMLWLLAGGAVLGWYGMV